MDVVRDVMGRITRAFRDRHAAPPRPVPPTPLTESKMRFMRISERRSIRRAYPLTCHVVRVSDARCVATRALDVSTEGMLVAANTDDIVRDDEYFVAFRAHDVWIRAEATLARVVEGRRTSDKQLALGLRFETIDPVHRLIMRGAFRKVPPPVPKRPPRISYAATLAPLIY
jgi:hypothetical protein